VLPRQSLPLRSWDRAEMLFLTPPQVASLADAVRPETFSTLIRFAAYTGFRAGESAGGQGRPLRGTVEVVESLEDVGGLLAFGPAKTYVRRQVPLPPFLRASWRATSPDVPTIRMTSCSPRPRGLLRHRLFYKRSFKPAVADVGLPEGLRFHDLRHTYAAFCIASTADPYAVMRRMGHSSITVTYDTYGHLFPERDAEITDRLEELFRRAGVDFSWTRNDRRGEVRRLPQPLTWAFARARGRTRTDDLLITRCSALSAVLTWESAPRWGAEAAQLSAV
jgi:integrase